MSAQALRMPRRGCGRGHMHAVAGCSFVASFAAPVPHPAHRTDQPTVPTDRRTAGHGITGSLTVLITVRLLLIAVRLPLGAGLPLGPVCRSAPAAAGAEGRAPGELIGSLEFFSKAGAVAAGVTAAAGSARYGPAAPALTGGAAAAASAALLPTLHLRTRWSR
ncbi:hypothetical protein ACFY5C_37415 [Streptomyces sp. NPDC012935]|uniref:hypothetical protein n=1 Tax=Streptomyces sp. NPDC012935 TaxID=3364857 RepID=UPI0036C75677